LKGLRKIRMADILAEHLLNTSQKLFHYARSIFVFDSTETELRPSQKYLGSVSLGS
jgi:hypothetical protein